MKHILILWILAAWLAGCAIVPAGYGDNRDGYYRQRDYNRVEGHYRYYGDNPGGGNYRVEHGQ